MLEKFADIYEKEMECHEGEFDKLILGSIEMRRFVFEVCKNCIEWEEKIHHNPSLKADELPCCQCPMYTGVCMCCDENGKCKYTLEP